MECFPLMENSLYCFPFVLLIAKGWEHSRRMCWASHSDLLTLQSIDEEHWLIKFLSTLKSSDFVKNVVDNPSYIWLGLSNFQVTATMLILKF